MKQLRLATACLLAFLLEGCSTEYAWRADGFGVSVSSTSISIVYGEVNRLPPGAYFSHTRSIDLRPLWKRLLFDPGTNSIAQATVVIDTRCMTQEGGCRCGGRSVNPEAGAVQRPCVTNEIFILPDVLRNDGTNNVMLCGSSLSVKENGQEPERE